MLVPSWRVRYIHFQKLSIWCRKHSMGCCQSIPKASEAVPAVHENYMYQPMSAASAVQAGTEDHNRNAAGAESTNAQKHINRTNAAQADDHRFSKTWKAGVNAVFETNRKETDASNKEVTGITPADVRFCGLYHGGSRKPSRFDANRRNSLGSVTDFTHQTFIRSEREEGNGIGSANSFSEGMKAGKISSS